MGKTLLLKAQIREKTGSDSALKVRKSGQIPAIIYGHKQEPVAVTLDAHNFIEGLHHGYRLMDVQIGKNTEKMIVKELQYDHLGKDIIHVDLMRVDVAETIRIKVPIELKGTAKGTQEGGIVEERTGALEIECRATDIPESIVVSVKELGIGNSLHAGDIALPEGAKLISPAETLVVTCHVVIAAKTAEEIEAEAPTAPEVIGEVKEAEEEPSEGAKE